MIGEFLYVFSGFEVLYKLCTTVLRHNEQTDNSINFRVTAYIRSVPPNHTLKGGERESGQTNETSVNLIETKGNRIRYGSDTLDCPGTYPKWTT